MLLLVATTNRFLEWNALIKDALILIGDDNDMVLLVDMMSSSSEEEVDRFIVFLPRLLLNRRRRTEFVGVRGGDEEGRVLEVPQLEVVVA